MGYMITKICQDLSIGVLYETCGVSDRRPDKCGLICDSYYDSSCVELYSGAACMYSVIRLQI